MTKIPEISKDNIYFVFIDLQAKLLEAIPKSDAIIGTNTLVLDVAKKLGSPVLVTTQYKKGLGELAPEIRERVEQEPPDKMTFSCSRDEKIAERLSGNNRQYVLCGVETHICVLQTALDLLRQGNEVAIVVDGVAARNEVDHSWGLHRAERSGALLVTSEMLIYEILKASDTPEFKQVLPLIKARKRA